MTIIANLIVGAATSLTKQPLPPPLFTIGYPLSFELLLFPSCLFPLLPFLLFLTPILFVYLLPNLFQTPSLNLLLIMTNLTCRIYGF